MKRTPSAEELSELLTGLLRVTLGHSHDGAAIAQSGARRTTVEFWHEHQRVGEFYVTVTNVAGKPGKVP